MNLNQYLDNDKEEIGLFEDMLHCKLEEIEEKRCMIKALREVKQVIKRILDGQKTNQA